MKAKLNAAALSKVPPTYLSRLEIQPNKSGRCVFSFMCKKTKKLAIARGDGSNPYRIDNEWLGFIAGKSARKMRSTTMYQKTEALSVFMGKRSNTCISLNQKELSPKLGGSGKTEGDLPRYPRKQSDLAQSDKMLPVSMLLIIKILIVGQKIVLRKKKGSFFRYQSRNVIENTCRKNVTFLPFHDIYENKWLMGFFPRCY